MKKAILWAVILLSALTLILSILHLKTRLPETEGAILINGEAVPVEKLELYRVEGTVVNAAGKEKRIDAQGIALSELCTGEYSGIRVTASDEYWAIIERHELHSAYLTLEEDGGLRLIVFGDSDARRDIKNVARIDME